ncbi:hypothetical protein Tsubulata_048140 [Turnera subulata]|uniref:Leucine-rich repeat-containing N-terminal plant-type domain-containing protein n=1 Tax=Turnera subulata TaxID=218843 RepID=A0A9Q0EZI1_9ROSI|nr:hypothetical protein Tsubulata_048140 [Turnera subulata]
MRNRSLKKTRAPTHVGRGWRCLEMPLAHMRRGWGWGMPEGDGVARDEEMEVHEDDDHDGGRKRSSKQRWRLTTMAWVDADDTCPLTSLEASYKRITLALTKPSYLLGHPAVSTLRQESRARLLNLLRRLESRHDWTEAVGALAVLLKGTRKDSSPDVNRFKYTVSLEFVRHIDGKHFSSKKDMDIERLYSTWMIRAGINLYNKRKRHTREDSFLVHLEANLFQLLHGNVEAERHNVRSDNISRMEIERQAFLKLKAGFTDPSGRLSTSVGNDCCRWPGVVCSRRSRLVMKLKLGNQFPTNSYGEGTDYALGGEISPSLLDLKSLDYLDLSMNNFEGIPIPKFFGSLHTLRYLNLSGAGFGGPIPPHLGNLSGLLYLDLNSYSNDRIDNELHWLSGLSLLKHLKIGNVELSKAEAHWLQAVNMLPSLLELHLPSCGLSTLPLSIPHVNFSSISVLDLSNNGFNNSTPPWLFNLSSLAHLDLNSNNLQDENLDEFARLNSLQYLDLSQNSFLGGKLSRTLGTLCNLRMLDLSANAISGEINDFIDGLSECRNSSLDSLFLGYNMLGGSLPDSIGHLRNLKHLSLTTNSFSGSIPESIGNLSSLRRLDLSTNQMKGSIAVNLGELSALEVLDLSENQWEGVITEAHFSNLTNLQELTIRQLTNNITLVFNASSRWIPPFKLKYLELKACLIGPKFPEWLRNQNELNYIVLLHAKISGTIPDWFWELHLFLDVLDISYNQITGSVLDNIRFHKQGEIVFNFNNFSGPLPLFSPNVSKIWLSDNLFSGQIPADFGERMPLLEGLDVSGNYLTGKLPDFLNGLQDVYLMDVSENNLTGNIPVTLGSFSSIQFLRLSNNELSGEIPSSLQNCTLLETLDLGDNRLTGKIPTWIGQSLPSLLILSLRANMLVGDIPSDLCSLSSLHILDLAGNNFSGHIPNCVRNLSGMTTILDSKRYEGQLWVVAKGRTLFYDQLLYLVNIIDLSGNNLFGDIPEGIASLQRLGTLNLSRNHLSGMIPNNIGNLKQLETLDLSSNNLSGTIPSGMASMTSLNHLNLSHNNLSGRIPTSNQFLTFIDQSIYEGNPGLCGKPLAIKCNGDDDEANHPPDARENIHDGDEDEHEQDMLWFFVSMAIGSVAGFWGFWGTLIVKSSWRHAYFQFIDRINDRLIEVIVGKRARARR